MMYMHYCPACEHLHILNGHKQICPGCGNKLKELKTSYLTYAEMDQKNRELLLETLKNPEGLTALSTTYRMLKYSKAFKDESIKVL